MIEYLLIFVLGFAAALLIVAIVSPIIRNRIIVLTERRVRATAPLSAAELRAEKDAARAVFAMENRRLAVVLRGERDRLTTMRVEHERLSGELKKARESASDLDARIVTASAEGSSLRETIGAREARVAELTAAIAGLEATIREKDRRIAEADDTLERLSGDIENGRIDMATREARIETLNSQIEMLRGERKQLREEAKNATTLANDLRNRLQREEERARLLDAKLADSVTQMSDREGRLERREREIERLKQKLLNAGGSLADEQTPLAPAADGLAGEEIEGDAMQPINTHANGGGEGRNAAIARRIEKLRSRHAALVDALANGPAEEQDETLREEIGEVAAMMIELAATREGSASPIHGLLAKAEAMDAATTIRSLAERARARLVASEAGARES